MFLHSDGRLGFVLRIQASPWVGKEETQPLLQHRDCSFIFNDSILFLFNFPQKKSTPLLAAFKCMQGGFLCLQSGAGRTMAR